MSESNWFTITQVTQDTYAIEDHGEVTIYLIIGSDKALVVDTGWGIGNLQAAVGRLTDRPVLVVNTHGHPDHCSGSDQFAAVYINPADLALLEGCYRVDQRNWALNNVLKGPFPPDFVPEQWLEAKPQQVIPLDRHQRFDLGNKVIEVIETPGHTKGSIVLLHADAGILFSGDSIIKGYIWLHMEQSARLSCFFESLKRLKGLRERFERILPAHGRKPLKAEIVDELLYGIEAVLQGQKRGRVRRTFAGDGRFCHFTTCGIVYNEHRF